MKIVLWVHVLMLFMYGCDMIGRPDETEKFIPGIYIRFSQHEFGIEHDTLVISVQNKLADEYKIVRKWKYERMLDGIKIEPEYRRQTTTAYYNSEHRLLTEKNTGTVYSFDIARNLLFNGPVKYKKT
jgi:hypothetical protein